MSIILNATGSEYVAQFSPGIRELTWPKTMTLRMDNYLTDRAWLEPNKVETWTGEGLPPVEALCEYQDLDSGKWLRCEVVAHRNNAAVVIGDDYECDLVELRRLRPIRTPDQIAAEERDMARTEILNAMTADGRTEGENEENWQFRMQIVGEILDMGYRKQAKP